MLIVDGLPIAELRNRRSAKWRSFPDEVLPLPVAEMDFEIAEPIKAVLMEMLRNSDTGYLGPIPELAVNFSAFAEKRWGWEVDPEQILNATDVGVAIVEMARMVVKPGDSIVINSPVYHNFSGWIRELKCEIVDAPLEATELHYELDLSAIESAYANGAKIHFLCNPHNPVGTVFSKESLTQLADLALKYKVAIFSDEIHAPLTFSELAFTPFLSVSEAAKEVGVCFTAASKSWNLAGLKCAIIVTDSTKWHEIAMQMPAAVHWRASLFGAVGAATAFECTEWLDAVLVTLDRNRKFLKEEIDRKLPGVKYRLPDFGYLAWLDLSALNLGEDPTAHILTQAKVALNSGQTFAAGANQFCRLNFGTSKTIISEAIDRIAELVKN